MHALQIARNERRTRRLAVLLAAALHIALGATLYLNTNQQKERPTLPVKAEARKHAPVPAP
jgi:cytochrome c-type biogenesis protein CcmE